MIEHPLSSRPVVFWANKDRPSSHMRGRQVAEALTAVGHPAEFRVGYGALRGLRDCTLVAIKNAVPPWIAARNTVFFDAIDYADWKGILGQRWYAGVFTSNEDMALRVRERVSPTLPVQVLYHHADPGIRAHRVPQGAARMLYVGEPENSHFTADQLSEVTFAYFKNGHWRDQMRDYNWHFSPRNNRNKAVVKLANAAVSGSLFLTAREPGCVELLGDDYPFYLRDHTDLSAVREDITAALQSTGSRAWEMGHARMRSVADKLRLDRLCKSYLRAFGVTPQTPVRLTADSSPPAAMPG